MSTIIQNRQPPGRPTGGQYATTEHAESAVTLGVPAAPVLPDAVPERPPAPPATAHRPARPWQVDLYDELYWDDEHEATPLDVVEPANRTMARRALSCPRLPKDRARLVVMHGMPGRRSSERDDHYKVVGPTSGQPLLIRIESGFHTLQIVSGNVRVEVSRSWGGLVHAGGGTVDVVVEGTNKHHVEFTGDATGTVRISDDARARVAVSGTGPVEVRGGGPDTRVWARPDTTVNSDTVPITPIGAAS